VQTIN